MKSPKHTIIRNENLFSINRTKVELKYGMYEFMKSLGC